jgi:acyl-CoA hydrolase
MKTKKPSESITRMTEMVLPNDTNVLGNLMGGRLMHFMDIAAAIAAGRHCNRVVVTASVDSVEFKSPIRLGEVITLVARVTRAFNTSLEVLIDVFAENPLTGNRRHCNTAFFTFVAVDQAGNPLPVNKLEPETEYEHALFEGALKRRELRLNLSAERLATLPEAEQAFAS